jgi:hypothetical protein
MLFALLAIASASITTLAYLYQDFAANRALVSFSTVAAGAASAAVLTGWILPTFFALPLRIMVGLIEFCLAVEYALKKPSTDFSRHVLQFAVLDAMVEHAVARASGAIRIAAMSRNPSRGTQ